MAYIDYGCWGADFLLRILPSCPLGGVICGDLLYEVLGTGGAFDTWTVVFMFDVTYWAGGY